MKKSDLKKMFSRAWLFLTLLILAVAALFIRLGIWQLDRLAQRRVFNAQVESMRAAKPLNLNQDVPADISSMEWRMVTVTGEYDFENQVALRNQYYGDQYEYGYHLITPLLFDPSTGSGQARGAVLVNRGWIPADGNATATDWRKYDEVGQVTVTGQIRLRETKSPFSGVADPELSPGQTRLDFWNSVDLARISKQISYPILSVYIEPNMDENDSIPPIPSQPVLDLTEGPHLGYALQWFAFAVILFAGYLFYLRKQE